MKRALVIIVALTILSSVPVHWANAAAESQGWTLFNEAKALSDKATSKEDLERTVTLYLEALSIFEKAQDRKGTAFTHHNLGMIYYNLSQYRQGAATQRKSFGRSAAPGQPEE